MAAATGGRAKLDPTTAEPAPPCVLVVFGAGGDLTKRLLVPALYNLAVAKLLDRRFAMLGINHRELSEDDFRATITESVRSFVDSKARRHRRPARPCRLRLAEQASTLPHRRVRGCGHLPATGRSAE